MFKSQIVRTIIMLLLFYMSIDIDIDITDILTVTSYCVVPSVKFVV